MAGSVLTQFCERLGQCQIDSSSCKNTQSRIFRYGAKKRCQKSMFAGSLDCVALLGPVTRCFARILGMNRWPDTESKLVLRLADAGDDAAWNQFDTLYRPVIYRYARSRGLQHSDAESLVADVMSRVFRAASRWSGQPGDDDDARPQRFRAWLRRIADNALLNLVTRQLSRRGTGGTSAQVSLAQRVRPDQASKLEWDRQHQQHLFLSAASRVQSEVDDEHWRIFWQTHVDGVSIQHAARQSGRSIGSVYAIRSRIVRRLRDAVERIERLDQTPLVEDT